MSILDRRGNPNGGNDDLASLEAGLDALETQLDTGPPRHRKVLSATWPRIEITSNQPTWRSVFAALPMPVSIALLMLSLDVPTTSTIL